MDTNKNKIDFVLLWVDGNDPNWRKEKSKYDGSGCDDKAERYRDWDNLQYWFRGVEKFAPWVNKIYFVTWGHLPKWLNVNNPKLEIVRHEDFIPAKYLPTFSTRPIELNLHRIKGLSEKFVYFNDDMFILKPVKETDFFKNDLPCDSAVLNAFSIDRSDGSEYLRMSPIFDVGYINKYFNKKNIYKHPLKWFNPIYGKDLLRSIALMPWKHFTGFTNYHLPYSLLKSTLNEIWEKEYSVLDRVSTHKFRQSDDVNIWLALYWQYASNNFYPRSPKIGIKCGFDDGNNDNILNIIKRQKCKLICINDAVSSYKKYERNKKELIEAFDKILPQKSRFEI